MFGIWTVVLLVACYLLGAVPFGVLIAKAADRDLTKEGSGNIGATNAFRSLGAKGGALVLVADVLKGTIACLLAYVALLPAFLIPMAKVVFGFLAILGHNYSVFRRFKGGKGIATTFGVALALSPKVCFLAALLWLGCVALTRYSSVGSLVSVASMPILMAFEGLGIPAICFGVAAAGLAIFRHKENLERLRQGRELRYDEDKTTQR